MANNIYPDIDDSKKFRLNHIKEIQDYLTAEIREREKMSKRISKYAAGLNFIDKTLVVLSTASGGVSIATFATTIGAPVGIASASIGLVFALSSGLVKMYLSKAIKKKHKHRSIAVLAKSKLNSIETMVSKAIENSSISHEEFKLINDERSKYDKLKEDIRAGLSNKLKLGDFEKESLIEQGQQMGVEKVVNGIRKFSGN